VLAALKSVDWNDALSVDCLFDELQGGTYGLMRLDAFQQSLVCVLSPLHHSDACPSAA
jgi:hypothetical protein